MKLRNPQRALFGAEQRATPAPRWREGVSVRYLGGSLRLTLDTDRRQAMRDNDALHLPLPPEATERQIQDAAESWLRREAEALFTRMVANETRRTDRDMPALSLSFSSHGGWVKAEHRMLRLNWRLIEQPLPVIALALRRAVEMLPGRAAPADLFSALA